MNLPNHPDYRVVFSPEAQEQLVSLYHYLARVASPTVAANYTDGIVRHCESLHTLPWRSAPRDDVRPGLRMTHYKKRTAIAFYITAETVSIVGIFYGGQDYGTRLQDEPADENDELVES